MNEKIIFSGLGYLFHRHRLRRVAKVKLLNEIDFNLRIIDMIEWQNVSQKFKYEMAKQFTFNEFQNFILVCSSDFLDLLTSKNINLQKEENKANEENENFYISHTINKIKTIQIISNLGNEFENDNKSRFDLRINNIKVSLQTLKSILLGK